MLSLKPFSYKTKYFVPFLISYQPVVMPTFIQMKNLTATDLAKYADLAWNDSKEKLINKQ
jgi:hypothetical protein